MFLFIAYLDLQSGDLEQDKSCSIEQNCPKSRSTRIFKALQNALKNSENRYDEWFSGTVHVFYPVINPFISGLIAGPDYFTVQCFCVH